MAVVSGTSAGFVSSQPINDPEGDAGYDDRGNYILGIQDTSPTGDYAITEIGWWCDRTGEEANFEVGIYSNDATGPDPNVLLASDTTNAKGTTAGWKAGSVSYALDSATVYWIAVQADDTTSDIRGNFSAESGTLAISLGSQTALPATWPGGGVMSNTAYAVYALYSAAGGDPIANMMYHYMHH